MKFTFIEANRSWHFDTAMISAVASPAVFHQTGYFKTLCIRKLLCHSGHALKASFKDCWAKNSMPA